MTKILSVALLFLLSASSFGIADTTPPRGSIDSPDSFATYEFGLYEVQGNIIRTRVTDIEGDARDFGSEPSGVDFIRVQVLRIADGQRDYWNGETFQPQPRWIDPMIDRVLFTGVSWVLPDVDLGVAGSYEVRLAIQDLAGNRANPIDNGIKYIETEDDNTDPIGTFVNVDPFGKQFGEKLLHPYRIFTPGQPAELPGNVIPVGMKEIRIQAEDQFGIEDVFYQVYNIGSGEYWNGTEWQSSPAWEKAFCCEFDQFARNFDQDFDYFADVDFNRVGNYWVRMNVRDNAGNISTSAESEKIQVRVLAEVPSIPRDRTAPTAYTVGDIRKVRDPNGTVRNLGGTAASADQDILGFANDPGGIGVERVHVQIERRANGTVAYWNGFNFQAGSYWVCADGFKSGIIRTEIDAPWRVKDVNLTTSGVYIVRLKVSDFNNNSSDATQNPISVFVVE